MRYRWPRPFPRNGKWGIVAPSAPVGDFPREQLESAHRWFEARGQRVVYSPNFEAAAGHSAGTVAQRVADLHWAYMTDMRREWAPQHVIDVLSA